MARDFAHKPKAAQGSSVPTWVWIFTASMAIGFVAFLYFLSAVPADKGGAEAVRKQLAIALREPVTAPSQSTPKPESLDDIKAKAETLKQAFEFYQLLENDEVSIDLPGDQPLSTEPAKARPTAIQDNTPVTAPVQVPDAKSWIIQVASFTRVADADRVRAELILSGLPNTEIQSVEVTGKGTYHRVMVGPFDHRPSLNKAQDTLAKLDYQVLVKTQ
ncbi:SPOR domain-containing protein [Reinekea sp.]|jgi:cell division protein FtsN|uniref:SPOR domain-containing protein n=1 Tax=Reinekea sp. TaxID=1970455 RepID=UPI002A7F0460|nr:SPOR domain-containing protein [Reinekea sp.]